MRTEAALQRDRELANARQRAYLARKNRTVVPIDELSVTCWCETVILRVPRTTVLDGRTDTCGRPACHAQGAA